MTHVNYDKICNGSVKNPGIKMPDFVKYYPSYEDLDKAQRKFYEYWKDEWKNGSPVTADLSYIYLYLYEVVGSTIDKISACGDTVKELEALRRCYEGVSFYADSWINDILIYHGEYDLAYQRMSKNQSTWDHGLVLNDYINIKSILGKNIEGKDLLWFAKWVGFRLSEYVKKHLEEAYILCDKLLADFKKDKGMELLEYIGKNYGYERRHLMSLFSGFPLKKCEVLDAGPLKVTIMSPETKIANKKVFWLSELSFFVSYALKTGGLVNDELKSKYGKRKSRPSKERMFSVVEDIQRNETFKNPKPADGAEKCRHEYLKLGNHWETYRKYRCTSCSEIFMCECEKDLVEKIRRYKKEGSWLKGICPTCRGFSDTSPANSGKLMYGSMFYAVHWREIDKERDRLLLEMSEKGMNADLRQIYAKIDRNDVENRVREKYGVPKIGEQWVSETMVYTYIKNLVPELNVVHHGRTKWLGRMHLDVYIPELKTAVEYQGKQHNEPVEYFGGEDGFKKTKGRDILKKQLCKENGVRLIYLYEGDDISENILKGILRLKE